MVPSRPSASAVALLGAALLFGGPAACGAEGLPGSGGDPLSDVAVLHDAFVPHEAETPPLPELDELAVALPEALVVEAPAQWDDAGGDLDPAWVEEEAALAAEAADYAADPVDPLTAWSEAQSVPWLTSSSIAFSLDGKTILVADGDGDSIALRDAKTLEDIATIGVCSRPEQIVVGPRRSEGFVSCAGDRRVAVININRQVVSRVLRVGAEPRGLALSPDGLTLYVAQQGQGVLVALDAYTGAPRWQRPAGRDPVAVAVTPDGAQVHVAALTEETVKTLDAADGQLAEEHSLPDRGDTGVVASMGRSLAVVPGTGELLMPYVKANVGDVESPRPLQREVPYYGLALMQSGLARAQVRDTTARYADGLAPGVPRRFRLLGIGARDGGSISALSVHPSGDVAVMVDEAHGTVHIYNPSAPNTALVSAFAAVLGAGPSLAAQAKYAAVPGGGLLLGARAGGEHLPSSLGLGGASPPQPAAALPEKLQTGTMQLHAGLRGVAISPDGTTVAVHNPVHRQVHLLGGAGDERVAEYAPQVLSDELELGRLLFHSASFTTSRSTATCASCHPDGRQDGRTWVRPLGPRQTPQLAGRVHETGPYGWLGKSGTLEDYVARTIDRLGGTGLAKGELAALSAWVKHGPVAPDNPHRPAPAAVALAVHPPAGIGVAVTSVDPGGASRATLAMRARARRESRSIEAARPAGAVAAAARGQEVFHRSDTGCSACHEPDSRFNDGLTHAVGTTDESEEQLVMMRQGQEHLLAGAVPPEIPIHYDTPSLQGVGMTAPYLHDGRAATLAQVFQVARHGRMGETRHLSEDQMGNLVAYLATL